MFDYFHEIKHGPNARGHRSYSEAHLRGSFADSWRHQFADASASVFGRERLTLGILAAANIKTSGLQCSENTTFLAQWCFPP